MQLPDWLWIILIGALVAGSCALVGCFLVLRRMAMLGDAISHAVLPGIAIAFMLTRSLNSWPMFLGATALGLLTVFLVQVLNKNGQVRSDAAIGVTFTALFALGVFMVSQISLADPGADLDTDCVLYGDIVYAPLDTLVMSGRDIGPRAFWQMAAIFTLGLLFITAFFKELKIVAFDPEMATAVGINVAAMHYMLMGLVSITAVGAFEPVGAILVVAMLVVPPATAYLLTDDLKTMLILSVLCGVGAAVLGYIAAQQWNASIAGAITVVAGLLFAFAFLLSPRHGVVVKTVRRRQLQRHVAREDVLQELWRGAESGAGVLNVVGLAALTQTDTAMARRAVGDLRHNQMVQASGDGFVLTGAGERAAQELVHRHRVYESYLDELGYAPDHMHAPADRVEHFIPPELVATMDAAAGNPTTDPHGKPIPHDAAPDKDRNKDRNTERNQE